MSKGLDVGGGSAVALGALALVGALVVPQSPLSVTGDSGSGGDADPEVKDATLNIAASPLGDSTKVSTTAYANVDGTVVTQSLSSGQFTAWSDAFTNTQTIEVSAFGSSYYPVESSVDFAGSTTVNEEIKVAEIASASDVSVEVRDDGDSITSIDLAAGERETIDAIRTGVDSQDVYFNAGAVYVEQPEDQGVDVSMPNAQEIAVPESAADSVDKAFRVYSPVEGGDGFTEFAEKDSTEVVIEADEGTDPSAVNVNFVVDDIQAYQDSDTGDIEYDLEDGDGNELGLSDQTVQLAVN
jgi:hypothetical protein